METCKGSGSIATLIRKLGTKKKWVVSFTVRLLYLRGKSPLYPVNSRLVGHKTRHNLSLATQVEESRFPGLPVRSLISTPPGLFLPFLKTLRASSIWMWLNLRYYFF